VEHADSLLTTPPGSDGAGPDMLVVEGLFTGYGRKQVVFDVNLRVGRGEIVALLGHNGSGKSTTTRCILGLLPAQAGTIHYQDRNVTGLSSSHRVKDGMALIPSERFVFADLTVHDNLLLGAGGERNDKVRSERLDQVYELFPVLKERTGQRAGTMSGGQQRMLSLGLAMMSAPTLLMLDEPSLGLAPIVVEQLFETVRRLASEEGLSVLLLEQNVGQALRVLDRTYVMRSGRVILEETAEQMRARDSYWDLF
jgi:branched-chain amino acid transport system ATP-binding protein